MAVFRIKIYKAWAGRSGPRSQWSNTYHINTSVAISSEAMLLNVQTIVDKERILHSSQVHFMRAVVTELDLATGKATGPSAKRVIGLQGVGGLVYDAGTVEFLNLTLRASFNAADGRNGSVFYRGMLTETMISASFDGAPNLEQLPNAFDQRMGELMDSLVGQDLVVLHKPPKGSNGPWTTSEVVSITAASASIRKRQVRRKKKTADNEIQFIDFLDEAVGLLAGALAFIATRNAPLSAGAAAATTTATGRIGQLLGNMTQLLLD